MGKLMKRPGRMLAAGVLVLAVAGSLMLAGSGTAMARPAGTGACKKINTTLASLNTRLAATTASASALKANAALIARDLTQAASGNSPAVRSAVHAFVTDLVAGVDAGNLDMAKLNAEAGAIGVACAASNTPAGAPATGGGSAAGLRDPAMFGLGGGAVLAGVAVLGLAWRSRRRVGVGHG